MLDGKRVLIVDDEPDVLASLEDLLSMCEVVKANNFHKAKELLETQYFDIAILDIMGVDGYKLLKIANERNVLAVMLTAHALSVDSTAKSFKAGAAYFVPKEKMANIDVYLNDVLEANERGKSTWWRWLDRFGAFYDKKFGRQWKQKNEEFWKRFPY
jgi:DNA-binding NtrC family response regulator